MVLFVGLSEKGQRGDTEKAMTASNLESPPPSSSQETRQHRLCGFDQCLCAHSKPQQPQERLLQAPLEVNPQLQMIAKCTTVLAPTVPEGWGGSGGDGPEWRISTAPPLRQHSLLPTSEQSS